MNDDNKQQLNRPWSPVAWLEDSLLLRACGHGMTNHLQRSGLTSLYNWHARSGSRNVAYLFVHGHVALCQTKFAPLHAHAMDVRAPSLDVAWCAGTRAREQRLALAGRATAHPRQWLGQAHSRKARPSGGWVGGRVGGVALCRRARTFA